MTTQRGFSCCRNRVRRNVGLIWSQQSVFDDLSLLEDQRPVASISEERGDRCNSRLEKLVCLAWNNKQGNILADYLLYETVAVFC